MVEREHQINDMNPDHYFKQRVAPIAFAVFFW